MQRNRAKVEIKTVKTTIQCKLCGKRKRFHPYAERKAAWTCNRCKKARQPKITVVCASCGQTNTVRASRVAQHDYYLCGPCNKKDTYTHPPKSDEMIRIIDLYAAGGFIGFTTRMATEAELESVERAKRIRDAGIKMLELEDLETHWIN
jgi:hypothetical protein